MEIQAIAGFSRLFFVIAVWNHYVFGSIYLIAWWTRFHFPIHTARLQRLCTAAVPFCCCAFVCWRGRTGETITIPDCCAPPILTWSLVVTSLLSRVCDVSVPSVLCFLLWSIKKKKAALLSGAYRLVQGYRPRFLQGLSMSTPFIWDIPCFFARVYYSSAKPFTIKKKKELRHSLHVGSCIFLYIWVLRDPTSNEKETKRTS